jgi:hypothetical protein
MKFNHTFLAFKFISWAYSWMKSTGIMTNASYPYVSDKTNAAGTCSFNRSSIIAYVSSYGLYKFPDGNATFIK